MLIRMITPAPPRSRYGNRVTALRWERHLRALGHRVVLGQHWDGKPCDLMIALHARRSFPAMAQYREKFPAAPLVLALTGTDLYRDIKTDPDAGKALQMADLLVTLQPLAEQELAPSLREKVRVVLQSAKPPPGGIRKIQRYFQVCVVGHLREEKDPFRAALASARLPDHSRIRVVHAGGAMDKKMAAEARRMEAAFPRYHWIGERPPWQIRRLLARSHLMVLSSRMEGGANVISEAISAGLPVLASDIPGSRGLLGPSYPGYYPVEQEEKLARLMIRSESDPAFYRDLEKQVKSLRKAFSPDQEQKQWKAILDELKKTSPITPFRERS